MNPIDKAAETWYQEYSGGISWVVGDVSRLSIEDIDAQIEDAGIKGFGAGVAWYKDALLRLSLEPTMTKDARTP